MTLLPEERVQRERIEPGAIVTRFAPSWLRIGNFDILRARRDLPLIQKLADYVAEDVFAGWDEMAEGSGNRYARLFRTICRRNAETVAKWQAYGFMNGVLNTDNTSLLGLSLDFGPFAFMDNFDPNYTPNHDDHLLRYSYRNQPSVIWWNLVRLAEALGELIGAGPQETVVERAERTIIDIGEDFKKTFHAEYARLMRSRLGLKTERQDDVKGLVSDLLDTMEALKLDFNLFFRRLSCISLGDLSSEPEAQHTAGIFFHSEDDSEVARERLARWLLIWKDRVSEEWTSDLERQTAMKAVNPHFIPRSWILDEIIRRVDRGKERTVLKEVMKMVEKPFDDSWGVKDEERWCGDVPREGRGMQCSCSS